MRIDGEGRWSGPIAIDQFRFISVDHPDSHDDKMIVEPWQEMMAGVRRTVAVIHFLVNRSRRDRYCLSVCLSICSFSDQFLYLAKFIHLHLIDLRCFLSMRYLLSNWDAGLLLGHSPTRTIAQARAHKHTHTRTHTYIQTHTHTHMLKHKHNKNLNLAPLSALTSMATPVTISDPSVTICMLSGDADKPSKSHLFTLLIHILLIYSHVCRGHSFPTVVLPVVIPFIPPAG